jgi:triosephosphate isomerase
VAGNWKMNTTLAEAIDLAAAVRAEIDRISAVERVICPPFVSLVAVGQKLRDSAIGVGAQNLFFQPRGAFTGEIAPRMLVGLVSHVIVGHSERRQYFGESDLDVNGKVKAALDHGLTPIVCVGENLAENEAGQTLEVVGRQVRAALDGVGPTPGLVVAYEPVWAIGTGRAATPSGANETIGAIRAIVGQLWGAPAAAEMRIQYGGSVSAANAADLFAQPEIDGALVGGASLKAVDFAAIVRAAAR